MPPPPELSIVTPPPELSIVIPTHDTRDLTLRCLETIFASPPPSGEPEVVLVDDASRDGTAEEVKARFPGVAVLRNETAGGFTRNRQQGVQFGKNLFNRVEVRRIRRQVEQTRTFGFNRFSHPSDLM